MHEYSIVQALLGKVEQEASARGATSVHALTVSLGELSGVEPVLFQTAFETFRERTICDGARLSVNTVPARWGCPACGTDVPSGAPLRCAACAGPARLLAGDEILLERIEMEVP